MIWYTCLLISLLGLLPTSSGFAAWLKCRRNLEEDEIIMNNKVKRAPAEEPVRLAIYDASGSRVDVPSDGDEAAGGGSIVWIDPADSPRSTSFTIRMDPETAVGLSDIQYVVETAPFDDSKAAAGTPAHHPAPTPMIPTVPTPAKVEVTSFVKASAGGGILCDGRRGYARGKNGSVTYELVVDTATKQTDEVDDGVHDASVLAEIVAGYSEYHGAVTLTPRVMFKRKDEKSSESNTASQGEL